MNLAVRVIHDPDAPVLGIAVGSRPCHHIDCYLFKLGPRKALSSGAMHFASRSGASHTRTVSAPGGGSVGWASVRE